MVLPDWSAHQHPGPNNFDKKPAIVDPSELARPIDRLAAVIVDVCVFSRPSTIFLAHLFAIG